jgi:hypothetical protein
MAQATDSLAKAHATCNTTDPVQALADVWGVIQEVDRAQIELKQSEDAAHDEKERHEAAVLALEPRTADEALGVLLVAVNELRHVQHVGALQSVVRWHVSNGATSPLLPVYADGRLHPKQPSVKP